MALLLKYEWWGSEGEEVWDKEMMLLMVSDWGISVVCSERIIMIITWEAEITFSHVSSSVSIRHCNEDSGLEKESEIRIEVKNRDINLKRWCRGQESSSPRNDLWNTRSWKAGCSGKVNQGNRKWAGDMEKETKEKNSLGKVECWTMPNAVISKNEKQNETIGSDNREVTTLLMCLWFKDRVQM